MQLRQLLISAALVSLIAACGPEVPNHSHSDPQPPPPPEEKPIGKIESFSLLPTRIEKGQPAKLSWSAIDAVSVKVTERSGKGVPGVDGSALTGEVSVSPTETTTYVLEAQGEGGSSYAIAQLLVADEGVQIPEEPLLLSAVPSQIEAGQPTSLVWSGPEAVVITNANGTVLTTGNANAGSLRITPGVTTTYTAKSGTQEVAIVVTVRPAINRFFATPAGAAAGQKVTLHWTTSGAEEVKISERDRKDLFTAPANLRNEGSFEDTIPAELPNGAVLAYTLTVSNASGIRTQTLEFTVSSVPTITEFDVQDVLTRGAAEKPTLTWKTTGAAKVSVFSGRAGTTPSSLLYVAPSTSVATGSIEIPLPPESTDFELIAEASQGGQTSKRISLEIVDLPSITSFTVSPATISNPGDLAQLSWTTTDGVTLAVSPIGGSSIYSTTTKAEVDSGTTSATAGNTVEFELVVTNKAGDSVRETRTLTVTSPIGFTFDPPIAVPGQQVSMNWDFPGAVAVYGAPVGETSTGPEPFIELSTSATATELTTLGNTTTARAETLVFPDGFKFRHFGTPYGAVQVTNRGWISFADTVSSTNITAAIPSAGAPNNFIAAWAGDSLRDGRVLWELQGIAPNRELIIQWDGFTTSSAGSALTFELILFESGMVQMRYKEMLGTGSTVTIGMEDATGTVGHVSSVAAAPAANDAITFNGAGQPTDSATFVTGSSTVEYELLVDIGAARVPVRATLPVIATNSVRLGEVMYKPIATATAGQWIEVHNTSGSTLDASVFSIQTTAGTEQLPSVPMPDDTYLVIGQSSDPQLNGDTPVAIVVPNLVLGTTDTVKLLLGTHEISRIEYDDTTIGAPAGSSVTRNTGLGSPFCTGAATYGSQGSKGSPGLAGEACGGYAWSPIPGNYQDIHNTGTVLMSADFWVYRALTFPNGFTFPFEGQNRTELMMGNGYVNFEMSTSTVSDPNRNNPATFPSLPGGIIAIFWDEAGSTSLPTRYVYQYFDPDNNAATRNGYLILQWSHMDFSGNTPDADMNYQMWLYENGDIDFQWAGMTSGAAPQSRALGDSATIGLSNVAGTQAVVYSHNEAKVVPNTGIRFKAN